jgi:ribosome biogenesis protein YTM1
MSGTLASGHNDNIIRLWDTRSSDAEAMKLTLRSHRGWVSGVIWRPNDAHTLASSSYDGTVKIWDIRSSIPLHTLNNVHAGEKALAIDWNINTTATAADIYTGGADNKLAHHRWTRPTSSE